MCGTVKNLPFIGGTEEVDRVSKLKKKTLQENDVTCMYDTMHATRCRSTVKCR